MPKKVSGLLFMLSAVFALLGALACGGGSPGSPNSGIPSPGSGGSAQHMVVVVLENKDYNEVVGSPSMPYLNGLIARGALATNYFANIHPSLGNYFFMTTGQMIAQSDAFDGVVTADNAARELNQAGKTWKIYAQGMPSPGYLGGDVYPYAKHHVPFVFFDDVISNPAQQQNIQPLTSLTSDISSGSLPAFSMIIPDQQHNGHDCPPPTGSSCSIAQQLGVVDQFVQSVVDPLLAVPGTFVVVTFDEAATDQRNGGGQVATVLAGTGVKPGFQSATLYQHQSLYRLILERNGVVTLPPEAASAPSMAEFFQ